MSRRAAKARVAEIVWRRVEERVAAGPHTVDDLRSLIHDTAVQGLAEAAGGGTSTSAASNLADASLVREWSSVVRCGAR